MCIRVDVPATGERIKSIMLSRGLTVKDVQDACGFTTPQAIYKWFHGTCLPTIDNLVIIADLFGVTMDEIVVVERKMDGQKAV